MRLLAADASCYTRRVVPLPPLIPLFPLPSVVLFPQVLLPLHIFEPRYRQMVKDVAAGDELVGMILLRGEEDPTGSTRDVYTVGCARKDGSQDRPPRRALEHSASGRA